MIQANVTVVVGTVQILSFTANPPNSTDAGSPVVLTWTTANTTSVVIIGGDIPPTTGQSERLDYHQPDQQPNVHLDRLWTWRPDRKRDHLGVREVA
jgi:hypothetical protein